MTTIVHISRHHRPGSRGYRYDVFLNETWLCTSLDPEFAACRVLLERGIRGPVEFHRNGKLASTIRDIEAGAKFCVREDRRRGPVVTRWRARESDEGQPRTGERRAA